MKKVIIKTKQIIINYALIGRNKNVIKEMTRICGKLLGSAMNKIYFVW